MTTTFCYVWSLWCACSFSGCEWAYRHGTLLCEFSIPISEESWEEMTKIEPRNKIRERKMRTKFFCTNFLNTARGPGHPGKIPGTSRIPLFKTQGRQSFEGGHEVFGHHPFAWKTPTPPGGLRTQKLNLCALFSCLKNVVLTWFRPVTWSSGHLGRRYFRISGNWIDISDLWLPFTPKFLQINSPPGFFLYFFL